MKKSRPLFFLYLTIFINTISFGMVFPLLPFYAKEFSATPIEIGFLATSFSIVQFFTSPILGRISDRFGRRPVLFWGLILGTFSMILAGLAQNLIQLFLARSLQGAVSAAILPTARAYMADSTEPSLRVAGMGKVGAVHAFGILIGPAFGSFLVVFGGIHLPFFVGALIAGVNALSVLFFLKESLKQKDGQILLKDGLLNFLKIHRYLKSEFGILFLILFAWAFALSNNNVSFPLFLDEKFNLNATHIGYFFTAMAIVSASIQGLFLPKIIKIMNEKRTIFTGMVFQGGGLLVMALSWSISVLVLGTMVMALGSALNRPTAEGIISRRAKTGQGEAMGIAQSFESLGRIFGPVLGGILYGVNFLWPFLLSVSLLWLLALIAARLLKIK